MGIEHRDITQSERKDKKLEVGQKIRLRGPHESNDVFEVINIGDSSEVDFNISPNNLSGDRVKEVTVRAMTPDGNSDPKGFIKKFKVGSATYASVEIVG